MEVLPTGAVTFLFTDIEGSTAAWEKGRDAMAADLEVHDVAIRSAVEANAGFVFATGGDSFSVSFGSPSSALSAAIAAQQSLVEAESPLLVRMGIHSGEAVERDGNYFGPALNRTARLMSLGHGGQVLVSATTLDLVEGEGFSFADLGEHRLKDLTKPTGVGQLLADGLGREFPSLRSAVTTGNLPLLGDVFGRADDIESLATAIDESHLVTLVGAGGIGKTTLAISTAREVASRFEDGCWLIDLTGLPVGASERAVADAVASVDDRFGSVDGLALRRLLLVLDNCEHVLSAVVDYLAVLLARAPGVTVLATSREPLGVEPETVVWVPPLQIDGSSHGDAVDLFMARAADVGAVLDLQADRGDVAAICRAVGGLPLAIELAAARAGVMTPVQILARLDDRLATLKGGGRGPEHHRTMEATIGWSYDLLDTAGQTILRRASVFDGGFDLEAAEAVCSDAEIEAPAVVDGLADLMRKSLLLRNGARFSLLESVRQFAASRLSHEEQDAVEQRHFDYFSSWAHERYQRAPLIILSSEELDWITVNVQNLRSAVRWGAEHDHLEPAAETATVLWPHFVVTASPDTDDWFVPLLGHLDRLDPEYRISVLHGSAIMSGRGTEADDDDSRRKLVAEYDLFTETGVVARGAGPPHNNLGGQLLNDGDIEGAFTVWEEGFEVARSLRMGVAALGYHLAMATHYFRSDLDGAMAIVEAAEAALDEFSPPYDSAELDFSAAEIHLDAGRIEEAWARAEHGLSTVREHGVKPDTQIECLNIMSAAAWQRGDRRLAVALILEGMDTAEGTFVEPWFWATSDALHVADVLLAYDAPQAALAILYAYDKLQEIEFWTAYFEDRYNDVKGRADAAAREAGIDPPPLTTDPKKLKSMVIDALDQTRIGNRTKPTS